jgi:predicted aspartyl protease
MGHDLTTRRTVATAIGATLFCGVASAAKSQSFTLERRYAPASHLQQQDAEDYLPPSDLKVVADIYRRMTVPVRINGAGPFGFVVDTGANQSVIAKDLADQLGLPLGPPAPLNGVAGVQIAPTTTAGLEIGRRVLAGQTLSVLPHPGIGGLGMLGLDTIGESSLTLDFAGKNLRIDSGRENWRDPDAAVVKARRRDGQLTLVNVFLGEMPLTAFIDSGAENTIGNMALRQMAFTRNQTGAWTKSSIISSTGQTMPAEIADLQDLRVGNFRVSLWPVAFADLHTFRMWDMVDKPAILIGVDILSRFQSVCLDFARDEVRFRMARA